MATTLLALFAVATTAAVGWAIISGRRDDGPRPFELGPAVVEPPPPQLAFRGAVFDPDRPNPILSSIRVALFVAVLSGLVAALIWAAGSFLKTRLDAYLIQ